MEVFSRPHFDWSNELALSASKFVQDLGGCPVLPDQVYDAPVKSIYIDSIATYTSWH